MLIRLFAQGFKKIRYKKGMANLVEEGALEVCATMKGSEPFFIGRNGTIELETIFFWLKKRSSNMNESYLGDIREKIQRHAGIFPSTDESIDAWCKGYIEALGILDGLAAGWYAPLKSVEEFILERYTSGSEFRCPLRSLEPYYVPPELRWTQHLARKRVIVISSFADTIKKQIESEKFPHIWTGYCAGLLNPPEVRWSFVRTGYSPTLSLGQGGWPSEVKSWQDAASYIVGKVKESGAEVAIIGCGGLGMIIGAELKRLQISSILLGGATQVLFGIKGTRWATHPVISNFWNDAWTWPSNDETPNGAKLVEGGCYW